MDLALKQMGSLIDGSAISDPLRDRRRGRRGPDGGSRACTGRQKGDYPRGTRSMRWTHLPIAGSGIWIPGGGRRRVRSWRGACDACLDAGGGTFAVADRGYSMGRPRRRNSLTEIFKLPLHGITRDLITSQAINWGLDAFARGAYSYATPKTREAQPRCENWILATYSFLAKHCMPAGIWAQSKRH